MKDGFVKVAAARINTSVADTAKNTAEILEIIKEAHKNDVKLLALPELCITGASCGNLFFSTTLLDSAVQSLSVILEESKNTDMVIALGMPIKKEGNIFNSCVVINNGNVLGVVPSTENSDIFSPDVFDNDTITLLDSVVPFSPDIVFSCIKMEDFSFDVTVGKLKNIYTSAAINVHLDASAEIVGGEEMRRTLIKAESYKNVSGYVYASAGQGESTTDMVYSGHLIIAENGKILKENTPLDDTKLIISEIDVNLISNQRVKNKNLFYNEDEISVFFDLALCETKLTRNYKKNPFIPENKEELAKRIEKVLSIQVSGLKKRITHTNAKSVVVGISGGLDSTLALLVCAKTMDALSRSRKDIIAVSMPCFGTTKRTKSNAEILCEELGVTFKEINISDAVKKHFLDIEHDINVTDLTFENSQARERTQVLMDIAGKFGGFVVGTGDLSELALGWATYNGDHMSMYGVNGGVTKTFIKAIVSYLSEKSEDRLKEVLYDIFDTPVSPELLPADNNGKIAQKTEDLVGPYELHDFFIYYFIRCGFSVSKIYRLALYTLSDEYSANDIKKWLTVFVRRFVTQQFKRSCLPDGVKVGTVSISPRGDFAMPSDASPYIFINEAENL